MPIKMKNLPVTERPYEKLEQYGEKAEFFEEVYSIRPVLKAKRM